MIFLEFNNKFPTEQSVIDYFIRVRYQNILTCPHCGNKIKISHRENRLKVIDCHKCNNTFSPFTNTIFEKSSTDMRKWFYAIHLTINDKKGISALQLQREIGVTYKTAWRMLHLIREAMGNSDMSKTFEGLAEVDETYIGGKPRKENKQFDKNGNIIPSEKPKSKRGRGTKKTPVVGVKERDTKQVYAQVMLPNSEGKNLTGKQLLAVIEKVCKDGTTIISDDFKGYNILNKKQKFHHLSVNHSLGEFCNGFVHTNNIENFWNLIKKQYHGTHHWYSEKYTQNYIDEMCFRQNHRKDENIFDILVKQCVLSAA